MKLQLLTEAFLLIYRYVVHVKTGASARVVYAVEEDATVVQILLVNSRLRHQQAG